MLAMQLKHYDLVQNHCMKVKPQIMDSPQVIVHLALGF